MYPESLPTERYFFSERLYMVMVMANQENTGCNPDTCESCSGCSGNIDKISLKVEWRHKGGDREPEADIEKSIHDLARDLAVSCVELTFVNNTFSPEIVEGTSEFIINGYPLEDLIPIPPDGKVTREILRKGIFQALLQNV